MILRMKTSINILQSAAGCQWSVLKDWKTASRQQCPHRVTRMTIVSAPVRYGTAELVGADGGMVLSRVTDQFWENGNPNTGNLNKALNL